jgi:hypothetical protein
MLGGVQGLVVALAVGIALAAALRSSWSPCGLSMWSTVTPLAESGRGHRFGITACWFIAGAIGGGLTLGLATALLALGVSALDLGASTALIIAAAAAAVGAASDVRLGGFHLPYHRRQVDETWLQGYRAWVYGLGYGWQLGVAFATYIMTSAIYLMVVLAALTADPLIAVGVTVLFGLGRGLALLPAGRIKSPEALFAFHRRVDALEPLTRRVAVAAQLVVVVVACAAVFGPIVAIAVSVVAVTASAAVVLSDQAHRSRLRLRTQQATPR